MGSVTKSAQNTHQFCDFPDALSYTLLAGPELISTEATRKVGLSAFSSQNKLNKLPKRSPVFVMETREIDFSCSLCFIATLMTELPGSLK